MSPSSTAPAQTGPPSPLAREQSIVSKLVAGDYYPKLQQLIGAEPDLDQSLSSGYTLYQFNRPWEYIDLLVKNGDVESIGIYAKYNTKFKAVLHAGNYPLILNGPSIEDQTKKAAPIGAVGFCPQGDAPNYFYEGFSLPMPNQAASFALGWVASPVAIRGTATSTVMPGLPCEAGNGTPQGSCYKLYESTSLSQSLLNCLDSGSGRAITQLSPWAVVVSAPYSQINPDMFEILPAP
jgi:hypothetical protein